MRDNGDNITHGPGGRVRPVGRILFAGGVLPLLVVLIGGLLAASWREDLPSPVAIHWGAGGYADGFASHAGMLAFIIGFGAFWGLAGLVFALVVRTPALARSAAGVGAGTGTFVAVLGTLLTGTQRGLADAADSRMTGWVIPVALAVGLVLGWVAARSIPGWETVDEGRAGAEAGDSGRPVDLGPTERVFWSRTITSNGLTIAVLAVAIPGTAAPVLVTGNWSLLTITLVLVVLFACLASIRVTVDDHGFLVRGGLRWPRIRVPLEDVASVRVVSVKALRDFGGYGLRLAFRGEAQGAFGFVSRSGDAVLIERRDGGRVVAVVDDAHTAAGLLNALVERAA